MTKTVFIYDQCGESDISYFVKDGDFSHMHMAYVNSTKLDRETEADLLAMLFTEDGDNNQDTVFLSEFPSQDVKDGAIVVIVGFLP